MTEEPNSELDPSGDDPPLHGPGWYPDPWLAGQQRYWSGEAWTTHVYAVSGAGSPATLLAPPRPSWSDPPAPLSREAGETGRTTPKLPAGGVLTAAAVVIGLVGGCGIAIGLTMAVRGESKSKAVETAPTVSPETIAPAAPPDTTAPGGGVVTPTPVAPAVSSDPAAPQLSGLVVRQSDVGTGGVVRPMRGGNQVAGQPTLDICSGTFPSEGLRTARLQDVAVDPQGNSGLSTEAVLYKNMAATAQAFAELKAVAAACPATPVTDPSGNPPVTTHFNPAPDASWPKTASVDRLALDFTSTDASGQTRHDVAVYLRRGHALLGLYFSQPDAPQLSVSGQTTIPGIVASFAFRLAALPAL